MLVAALLAASLGATVAIETPAVTSPAIASLAMEPGHPSTLDVGGATQVVVVTSPRWSSTRGTLRAYEWRDGRWQQVVPDTPAWLGYGGMVRAEKRRQGTGTTPAGTFAIPSAFGRKPDPGTRMPYLRFDRDDAWPYDPSDPATYNVFQERPRWSRWDSGFVEWLWRLRDQYRYVAVLDYNLPAQPYVVRANGLRTAPVPADTRRGGGIFLHVDDDRPTAGCIAVDVATMRTIMTWLDPAASPVLVAAPESAIDRL